MELDHRLVEAAGRESFQAHARTHVGKVRARNEDAHRVLPEAGLVVVADGMGGHRAGDVASQLAVETAVARLTDPPIPDDAAVDELRDHLLEAVRAANLAIYERAQGDSALTGMGTTLVAAVFRHPQVVYAHVGDSRLYRLRAGRMRQLTRDHSLIQQLIDSGLFRSRAEARAAGVSDNVLTRSLGLQTEIEIDVGDAYVDAGDVYLLCSDGLTGKLGMTDFIRLIGTENQDLERASDLLCTEALDRDGSDNITLILARAV